MRTQDALPQRSLMLPLPLDGDQLDAACDDYQENHYDGADGNLEVEEILPGKVSLKSHLHQPKPAVCI